MKNFKGIIICMVILIICIIIVTVILLVLNNQKIREEENPETLAFVDTEKITNRELFYNINNQINNYLKNITDDYVKFQSQEMYTLDKIDNITVFVYGVVRQSSAQYDYYYIINLDYSNNTFELIESTKEEYELAVQNQVDEKYKEDIRVQSNGYNEITNEVVDNFEVAQSYFEDYKWKAMYNYPKAFELLDEEYKKAKFNNSIEEFKTYLQNNIDTLQDANIVKHGITSEGGNTKYTIVDNFGNTYTLIETEPNTYTISLDNYTVEDDDLKQQYNSLSNEEKAVSNIDKIMKLINQKEYSTVYGYLNTEFKNTNFPTLESFTSYVKENFFDNNRIGNISVGSEGSIYMLSVPYKESLSSAAEEKTKTFIMKLNEGTNFEISFEI